MNAKSLCTNLKDADVNMTSYGHTEQNMIRKTDNQDGRNRIFADLFNRILIFIV